MDRQLGIGGSEAVYHITSRGDAIDAYGNRANRWFSVLRKYSTKEIYELSLKINPPVIIM